jgi:hypothetical protein
LSGGNSGSTNNDRSARSFSGGDSQSSRSLGNSSSNLSRILGNTSGGVTSNSSPRFQSPDNSGTRSFNGFAGNNKGGSRDSGQASARLFQNGAGQNTFRQNDGRSNVDRAQLSNFLNNKGTDRSSRVGNNSLGNNSSSGGNNQLGGNLSGDAQRVTSGQSQFDRGRFGNTGRASGDQVRNFLNLRGNENTGNAANDKGTPGSGSGGNNNIADRFDNRQQDAGKEFRRLGNSFGSGNKRLNLNDSPNNQGDGSGNNGSNGKENLADRLNGRNNDGGRDFRNRGDLAGTDNNRFKLNDGLNNRGDGPGGKGNDKDGPNLGKGDNGGNRWNDGNGRDGNNFRDGKNWDGKNFDGNRWSGKDFRGKDSDRHAFNKWNDTWKGKDGKGRDHRDWSGKWRDGHRFETARHIRNHWWNRHDHDHFPFCGGWWGRGHGWGFWDTCAFSYNRPFYWWGWTTAPLLTSWCDFGWSTPYYWDYGPGEYIYCNNGIVYVNGTWFEPAPVFYAQTLKTIDAAPVITEELAPQVEWLPLGVFAVTPDGLNEPNIMAQLAVTKDGVIGGTVFDQKLNKSFPVQGTIDKNTQRAMWSYTNDQNVRVVMETSVNNLTQNESTGLVHYGPNDQRVVEIVRLEDPSSEAKATGATPPVPPQQTPPQQPQQVPPPVLPQ